MHREAACVAYVIVALVMTIVLTNTAENTGGSPYDDVPLRDVVHARFQNWVGWKGICDWMLLPICAFGLYAAVHDHKVGKYVKTLSALFILRALCIAVTVLPSSHCKQTRTPYWGRCRDQIISGHTLLLFVAAHAAASLHPSLAPAVFLYAILGGFLMTATQRHYTVDVILAAVLSVLFCDSGTATP